MTDGRAGCGTTAGGRAGHDGRTSDAGNVPHTAFTGRAFEWGGWQCCKAHRNDRSYEASSVHALGLSIAGVRSTPPLPIMNSASLPHAVLAAGILALGGQSRSRRPGDSKPHAPAASMPCRPWHGTGSFSSFMSCRYICRASSSRNPPARRLSFAGYVHSPAAQVGSGLSHCQLLTRTQSTGNVPPRRQRADGYQSRLSRRLQGH
jgi:hypothetical protein